jgi:hypothetical protein
MTTMKITTKHMDALTLHLADALGAGKLTAAAVIGDEATYDDLAAVDASVVSEALRDASAEAPPLKRGAAARLFALLSQGAATCNRCGRLALSLTGSTWSRVDGATCPVDAGLYEAERVEMVRAWTDGREYPKGTTHDANRVPIDSSTIRVSRGVSEMIDAALRETGATLPDVLAALEGEGMTPVQALAVVGSPLASRFVDTIAVREFAQRARGAMERRARTSADVPLPIDPTVHDDRAVRGVLVALYGSAAQARRVVHDAFGSDVVSRIDFSGGADTMWSAVLAEARRHTGGVEAVLNVARREYPNNPGLRGLDSAVDLRRLTGDQWAELQGALLDAFRDERSLARVMRHGFDENLNAIASGNLKSKAYEVIQWSQARGWTRRLIEAARAENATNDTLRSLAHRWGVL